MLSSTREVAMRVLAYLLAVAVVWFSVSPIASLAQLAEMRDGLAETMGMRLPGGSVVAFLWPWPALSLLVPWALVVIAVVYLERCPSWFRRVVLVGNTVLITAPFIVAQLWSRQLPF